jgi:type IX secretion system PorP/SprF family membrane protein
MKRFLSIVFFLFYTFHAISQDIHFSQLYEKPLLRNPALAGTFTGDIRVIGAFRNQWQTIPVDYRTSAASVEYKYQLNEDFVTFGVQMIHDVAGDSRLGKRQFLPVVAYSKLLNYYNNTYITGALSFGFVNTSFDMARLRFGDQFVNGSYSPTNPTNVNFLNSTVNYRDLSTGILLSGESGYCKYLVGAAYFHFNDPQIAFSSLNDMRLNRKVALNAQFAYLTSESGDRVVFYGDYFRQGGNNQFQGGVLYKYTFVEEEEFVVENESLSLGCFYRWNDAIIPIARYQYNKWTLGVSYDVNASKLRTASQFMGGYELMLSYRSFLNINIPKRYNFGCYMVDPNSGIRKGRKIKWK